MILDLEKRKPHILQESFQAYGMTEEAEEAEEAGETEESVESSELGARGA